MNVPHAALGTNSSALPKDTRTWADGDFPSATLSPTLSTDLEGPHLVFVCNKSSVPLWSYTGIFRWPGGVRGTATEIQLRA